MFWFGAVIVGGLLTTGVPRQDAIQIPEDALTALEKEWDRAVPSDLPPEAAACLDDGQPVASRLTGDLDNDGRADYVVPVQTPEGLRLVALLYRLPDYVVFQLDELGAADSPVGLALARPGTRFTPAGGIDDYYPATTVLGRRCGQPDVAYVWTGFSFRRTPLAGGRAAAHQQP